MATSAYLPHLDGLRAIALAGVLLFHFRVPFFQGGFSGVDVFLSLSGFLITRNIARDLANRSFTLRSFYFRRFLRLYPASVVTVIFALILALLVFPPPLATSAAASVLAALLFSANTFFNAHANYFDAAAITKPLLHTWSLSLEEQYYFFFPPLLVLIYRFIPSLGAAGATLAVLFTASLSLAIILYPTRPSFVFFHLPARVFQFAAGALVALLNPPHNASENVADDAARESDLQSSKYEPVPTNDNPYHTDTPVCSTEDDLLENTVHPSQYCQSIAVRVGKEILAISAVSGLFASYIFLQPQASPLQMTPTTLSTCVILMLPDTFLSEYILSNKILRFIGHISYSAYLVHWPLWVFLVHVMRALRLGLPNPIMMIFVTLLAGTFLRQTVEIPSRQKQHHRTLAVSTVLVACVAVMGVLTNGYAFRFGNIDFDLSNSHQAMKLFKFCRNESGARSELLPGFHVKTCRVGDLNGTRSNYAFFGDSFTLHLAGALDGIGKRRKEWYGLHFQSGCHFLPHAKRKSISETRFHCIERHDELWSELNELENGTVVTVANSWGKGKLVATTFPSLVNDIRAAGHRTAMVAEPPGLSAREERYFDCADFAIMPISKLWQLLRKGKFEGAKECANLGDGLRPFAGRVSQATAYRKLAEKLGSVELIEVFDKLCSERRGVWRCAVPRLDKVVYDIGYRRDRRHLTEGGSTALSRVYEDAIFARR